MSHSRTVCCWLIASVCLAACLADDSFKEAWQAGQAHMQAKQWTPAREAFDKALKGTKHHGKKADAELQIGRCFEAEGKSGEAMKAFVNSMRWRFYAASRLRGGVWPSVRDEFRRILDVPVTRETAETVIFKALAEIGIAREWRRHRVSRRAEEHYLKALEWLRAPQVSNKSIQQRDLRQAYLGLAEVRADLQDIKGAQDALRMLLEVPGGAKQQREVQHRLWALCRMTGDFETMRTNVRAAADSADVSPSDRVDVQFQIAYSYIYERRYEEARSEFATLLTMPAVTPQQLSEAQLYVAHTHFVTREYARARPLYERVLHIEQAPPDCVTTAKARIKAIDALSGTVPEP